MNQSDETVIADFLKAGGRVRRVKDSVPVTESELLDYLANCGMKVKHSVGDSRIYLCEGKRVSATKLIAIANEHRRSLQLPPFGLRVSIRYAGRRAAFR